MLPGKETELMLSIRSYFTMLDFYFYMVGICTLLNAHKVVF